MKTKILFFRLALVSSLVIAVFMNIPYPAKSAQPFPGKIDLFTQKTPFDGKGPNQPSDTFQQQELVILYALVTFNEDAISDKVVGFEVKGPANPIQNITLTSAAVTNESGIAEFSFRMPTPASNAQQTVFGEWFAVATVDIDQVIVNDTLTFGVGWLVRITHIATLNEQLNPQVDFTRQSPIVFNLTLENIALTPKIATIMVDAQDVAGKPIIHIELDNQTIPPGQSYTQTSSKVPADAKIGQANVSATPYTFPPQSGGIPYSPSVSSTFNIVISAVGHDVAIINIEPSASQASVGDIVEITVTAANLGNSSETFNVTVYYDSNVIQVIPVNSLPPNSSKTITVEWNTANVNPGVYTISANATLVPSDINPENNNFIDGTVTLIAATAPSISWWLLLIPFIVLAILAALAFIILLLAAYRRPRRRRKRKSSRYVVLIHPHV